MAGSIGRHVELSSEVYYGDMALDCAPPGTAGPQETGNGNYLVKRRVVPSFSVTIPKTPL